MRAATIEFLPREDYRQFADFWLDGCRWAASFPVRIADAWLDSFVWAAAFPSHAYTSMPWSGDVAQLIHAFGQAFSQFGLFNLNYVNSENSRNPSAERSVMAKYSYGRQLGRILDVLAPLVEQNAFDLLNAEAPEKKLGSKELKDFRTMVNDVKHIKELNER